jgi:diacylglycerol kinase family enzyme
VKVVAIVNPTKLDSIEKDRRRLSEFTEQLGHAAPEWVLTNKTNRGSEQARRAVSDGAELVLVWGGDGTVTSVAEGMADSGVPLGLLPGGTGNLLARNLDVPLELSSAVHLAYTGMDHAIDLMSVSLGRGERRISTVMCGTGWDAVMMDVSEKSKARLGWGAYALRAVRTFRDHPLRMRVCVDDGQEFQFYGRTCLIANVGTLVAGLTLLPESKPDDGSLEVLVFDPTTMADYARTTWGVLRGLPSADDPARTVLRGTKAVVTTHKSRPRQIDGDLVSDGYGFVVRIMPGALIVRRAQ